MVYSICELLSHNANYRSKEIWKITEPDEMDNSDDDNQSNARYDRNFYCRQRVVYNAV